MSSMSAFSLVSLQVLQNIGRALPQLLCTTSVSCKEHPTNMHGTPSELIFESRCYPRAYMAFSQWVTRLCFASSSLFRQIFGALLSNWGVSILSDEVSDEHL